MADVDDFKIQQLIHEAYRLGLQVGLSAHVTLDEEVREQAVRKYGSDNILFNEMGHLVIARKP